MAAKLICRNVYKGLPVNTTPLRRVMPRLAIIAAVLLLPVLCAAAPAADHRISRSDWALYMSNQEFARADKSLNEAYRLLAKQIEQPLHLGITEAGGLRSGTVKSAVGLGMLLAEGIGDTIRISLAADPVEEIKVGYDILKSLRLRSRGINFIACPSCSRQNFDVVKTMNELEQRVEDLLVPLDVAVIGCVVNGPGEAKEAHIGLTGGTPNNLVYIDGAPASKLTNDNLVDELEKLIRREAAEKAEADAAVIARG